MNTAEQLEQVLQEDEYSYIYAPMGLLDGDTPDKFRIIVVPPVFLADCENDVIKKLSVLRKQGYEHMAVHTLSHIGIAKKLDFKTHGMSRLNITNRYSLREYEKMGLSDTALSFELLMSDAVSLCADSEIKIGIVGYGRLPLMITRRCPINNGKPCGQENGLSALHHRQTGK